MSGAASPGDLLLGRFRLLRALGEDGPSSTWLAEDAELGEHVVLRILAAGLGASQLGHERLSQACREARRLKHPNIARVHDFHRQGELCFVSREYVATSAATAAELSPEERSRTLTGLIDALAYAHDRGVVHGDIKVSKILWDESGTPHLADFRIAAELRTAARALGPPTEEGEPATPSVSEDVRALGTALFELLTGRGVDETDPRSVSARLRGSDIEPGLADAIGRMLETSPDARPALASVRADLDPSSAGSPRWPIAPPPAETRGDDDVIIPVPVRSPAEALPPPIHAPTPSASAKPGRGILTAFAVLLVVAVAVIFFLPRWVGPREEAPQDASVAAQEGTGDSSGAELDPEASDSDARQLLVEVLELQEQLGEQKVAEWAPREIRRAGERIAEGEKAQIAGKPGVAARALGEARDELSELVNRVPQVLGEALAAGAMALERGDDEEATRHFELALALEPGNAEATAGLAHAEHLDEVMAQVASAARYEADGKPSEARDAYGRALEIDAESKRAREGFDRLSAQLAEAQYARGMARATQALARGDLTEASQEVKSALAARPDSAEARVLRSRIQAKQTQSAVARHLANARRRMGAGEWAQAVEEYQAALARDPELGVAQAGLARSERYARIASQLSGWIADPDQLLDRRRRADAGSVLAEARGLPDVSQHFGDQIAEVERLVASFSTPVTVVFESDNETQVTIQKLRELGSFERREVALDPGTYVVVGIRRGYRDVRRTLTVTPGRAPEPVTVRCSQPI